MFKGEASKKQDAIAKETTRSELQKDVQLYDVLKKYLTIYLATVAIPNYKKQRIEAYVRAMGRMADAEVRNAENTYDCWNNFQKTIISYNIKYWVWEVVKQCDRRLTPLLDRFICEVKMRKSVI